MKRITLGNTGIEVSELSFGTLILGRIQADLSPEAGAPAIARAVELGINFFDTAQAYGTQDHLRIGLGRAGNDVVLASKTHAKTRADARDAFDESRRQLGRDYVDIYHLHLVESAADLKNRREVLDFFLELKEKGDIGAVGASVHRVAGARAVADEPDMDILFPVLNARGLGIPDGSAEEMIAVCRRAQARGMGIYAMKPLAGGHLRENPAEAFAFIRGLGIAHSVCVGMKSPAEVEMNVHLFEGREVPPETIAGVETVKRSLKIYDFLCVGCGACVEACDQGALSLDLSKADESKGKKGESVVDRSKCMLCGYCAHACPKFAIRVV